MGATAQRGEHVAMDETEALAAAAAGRYSQSLCLAVDRTHCLSRNADLAGPGRSEGRLLAGLPRLHAASTVIFLARASAAMGAFNLNMPFLNSALTLSASIFFGR